MMDFREYFTITAAGLFGLLAALSILGLFVIGLKEVFGWFI